MQHVVLCAAIGLCVALLYRQWQQDQKTKALERRIGHVEDNVRRVIHRIQMVEDVGTQGVRLGKNVVVETVNNEDIEIDSSCSLGTLLQSDVPIHDDDLDDGIQMVEDVEDIGNVIQALESDINISEPVLHDHESDSDQNTTIIYNDDRKTREEVEASMIGESYPIELDRISTDEYEAIPSLNQDIFSLEDQMAHIQKTIHAAMQHEPFITVPSHDEVLSRTATISTRFPISSEQDSPQIEIQEEKDENESEKNKGKEGEDGDNKEDYLVGKNTSTDLKSSKIVNDKENTQTIIHENKSESKDENKSESKDENKSESKDENNDDLQENPIPTPVNPSNSVMITMQVSPKELDSVCNCVFKITRGENKGKKCGVKSYNNRKYCYRHFTRLSTKNSTVSA